MKTGMLKKISTKKPLKKAGTPVSKKIRKEADAASEKIAEKTIKKVEAKKGRQKSVKAKQKPALKRPKKEAKKIPLDRTVKEKAVKKVPPEKNIRSTETIKGRAAAREQKKVPLKVKALEKKKRAGDLKKSPSRKGTFREKIPARTEKPGKPQKRKKEIRLPEEYGENELLLMVVDPHTVYASWEITKDSLPQKDDLTARIFDVTGVRSEVSPFDHFLEIGIDRRVGSGFFDIRMPGREVIMEIGLFEGEREFKAIVRSKRVSIPTLLTFDELGIVKKLFEEGIPVGY